MKTRQFTPSGRFASILATISAGPSPAIRKKWARSGRLRELVDMHPEGADANQAGCLEPVTTAQRCRPSTREGRFPI